VAEWLRRAGQGRNSDGSLVIWSVAEGRRGRRWREVVVAGGAIRTSLLLELDPDGRFSHLELSTAAGLLTLHPEGDRTLHGNAVTKHGVGHVVGLPWDPDGFISVDGSNVTFVVLGSQLFGRDRGPSRTGYHVGLDLSLSSMTFDRSELAGADLPTGQPVADAGLPMLDGGSTWPLEQSD
jgi:hypothetical protein